MKLSAGSLWDDASIQRVGMQSLLDLFNDSCAGMMAVDLNARVAWINDKYVALLGLSFRTAACAKWLPPASRFSSTS